MWSALQGCVYLAPGVTDMRKSINSLAIMVVETLGMEPVGPHWFVFCGRERDKIKILQWDTNGFWLHYRRLEQGRFVWPPGWAGPGGAASHGAPAALAARWLAVAERGRAPVDGPAPRLLKNLKIRKPKCAKHSVKWRHAICPRHARFPPCRGARLYP
jgi:hypothetical protein